MEQLVMVAVGIFIVMCLIVFIISHPWICALIVFLIVLGVLAVIGSIP